MVKKNNIPIILLGALVLIGVLFFADRSGLFATYEVCTIDEPIIIDEYGDYDQELKDIVGTTENMTLISESDGRECVVYAPQAEEYLKICEYPTTADIAGIRTLFENLSLGTHNNVPEMGGSTTKKEYKNTIYYTGTYPTLRQTIHFIDVKRIYIETASESYMQDYIDLFTSCTTYDDAVPATCYDLDGYICKERNLTYDNRLISEPCIGNDTYTSLDACETARDIKRGCSVDADCLKEMDAQNDCSLFWEPHKINQSGECATEGCVYPYTARSACSSFSLFLQNYLWVVVSLGGLAIIGGIYLALKK